MLLLLLLLLLQYYKATTTTTACGIPHTTYYVLRIIDSSGCKKGFAADVLVGERPYAEFAHMTQTGLL